MTDTHVSTELDKAARIRELEATVRVLRQQRAMLYAVVNAEDATARTAAGESLVEAVAWVTGLTRAAEGMPSQAARSQANHGKVVLAALHAAYAIPRDAGRSDA